MVLNSTFTKKTDRCWQDENIYLTKRFVIVIMHQLKGYFNVFSMTFCNKCVHKKYSKLLPLPSLDKNPRQELFKSPPPTFFFLFLIQHFLKCGAASRHPAERGGLILCRKFSQGFGGRGGQSTSGWENKATLMQEDFLVRRGMAGDISLGDSPIMICSVLRDLVLTSFLK